MPVQRLHTDRRLSEINIHNGTVYLAGQLADDFSGDIYQQTRETLANVDKFLAEAGSDKQHILVVTIFLRDIALHFEGMNRAWDEWAAQGATPGRTTVEAKLAKPDILVEMNIIAAVKV
ncbi:MULTISPECIES: RidA family protein [unclassified Pseudomonas]|uniref:RidA family protein n=1 Tax=unclassified Pseudomonas TaxID=196821 RepID=UPI00235F115D|nr:MULTISPECIES: RidA family protein [unclassified Pseudomonas]